MRFSSVVKPALTLTCQDGYMKHIRPPLAASPLPIPALTDPDRSHDLHPADELARIRAAMTQLRIREAALLGHFRTASVTPENCPDHLLRGDQYRVRLTPHVKRVFDPSRLPQTVLANPQYYRRERHLLVTTLPDKAPVEPVRIY